MQKRTSYEFEGQVGYTYVTKAYGNTDVRFEAHFRASDNDVDVIQFGCGLRHCSQYFAILDKSGY